MFLSVVCCLSLCVSNRACCLLCVVRCCCYVSCVAGAVDICGVLLFVVAVACR